MDYKITDKDICKDIKGFPMEIVSRMIKEQVKQGNDPNITVFQNECSKDGPHGGFTWEYTEDRHEFWSDVIDSRRFDVFFKKYPERKSQKICIVKL